MSQQLFLLRDSLSNSLEKLLNERDQARVDGDAAKETTAQAEANRIARLVANAQMAINAQTAMNLDVIARRLEDSIEAQQAVGLSAAIQVLLKAIERLRTPSTPSGGGGSPAPAPGGGSGSGGGGGGSGTVVAKPGEKQALVQQIIDGAVAIKIDPLTVLAIVAIESDFRPHARSPLSSAGGLFQFIDGTWKSAGGSTGAGGGKGNGFASHAEVEEQVAVGCKFIKSNMNALKKKLDRAPSPTAVYMAHQQGLGGALKLLTADKTKPVESIIGGPAARNNRLDGLTVSQAIQKFNVMVRSHVDEVMQLVAVSSPPSDDDSTSPQSRNSFAEEVVEIALSEMELFAMKNGQKIVESVNPLSARIREYFNFVGAPGTDHRTAWSAAYISFVMRSAGLTGSQFPKSANHAKYILRGLANQLDNKLNASIVYFEKDKVAPRVGDLIGFSRQSGVNDTADIKKFLPDTFFKSHTDLVIDVRPGKLTVIGGNVSNTIKATNIDIDTDGKILKDAKHFFVLRINV